MKLPGLRIGVPLLVATLAAGIAPGSAWADTSCTFTVTGTVMRLDADCWTDAPIVIPDGFTLDGAGHSITAFDPPGGHFKGAVVVNGGTTANVEHLTILSQNLTDTCDAGADRLRGIMFDGASGTIAHNTIVGINQGPSPCQEGNAIEARNAPFDGTHPNTQYVRIFNNRIEDYQKTGIVANGDVYAEIVANHLGSSATQPNLAANGIQIGFGGAGTIRNNEIGGNTWCGGYWAATAVLLYLPSPGTVVSNNNIRGNADVGIDAGGDYAIITNNRVFEDTPDCGDDDIGVGVYGVGNTVVNNKSRGYDTPFDGVVGGKNKAIPSPHR